MSGYEQSDLESPLNKLNVFNIEPMCIKEPLCEHGFRESCVPKRENLGRMNLIVC